MLAKTLQQNGGSWAVRAFPPRPAPGKYASLAIGYVGYPDNYQQHQCLITLK